MCYRLELNQDFNFDILSESSIPFTTAFPTAILHSKSRRAFWQPRVRIRG